MKVEEYISYFLKVPSFFYISTYEIFITYQSWLIIKIDQIVA
jgi:hypothetical protein